MEPSSQVIRVKDTKGFYPGSTVYIGGSYYTVLRIISQDYMTVLATERIDPYQWHSVAELVDEYWVGGFTF